MTQHVPLPSHRQNYLNILYKDVQMKRMYVVDIKRMLTPQRNNILKLCETHIKCLFIFDLCEENSIEYKESGYKLVLCPPKSNVGYIPNISYQTKVSKNSPRWYCHENHHGKWNVDGMCCRIVEGTDFRPYFWETYVQKIDWNWENCWVKENVVKWTNKWAQLHQLLRIGIALKKPE